MLGLFVISGLMAAARGAFFPDPVTTAEYDIIAGDIFGGNYGVGSEVAAFDQSGTIRFRYVIDVPNSFGFSFFYEPTGSLDPRNFTWQLFDGRSLYSAVVYEPGTTWTEWEGLGNPYIFNLQQDQPLMVIPEPATLLVLSLLGGSGIVAGLKKKGILKL